MIPKKHFSSFIGILSLFAFLECDREWTSPFDANYHLSPPTLLSVEPLTDTNIRITWENNENFANGFITQRKVASGDYTEIGDVDITALSIIDTSCELGLEYTYVIRSKIETKFSANSNMLTGATSFPAPSELSVSIISDNEILITWVDNCNFEAGFRLERNDGNGFTQLVELSADATTFTDSSVSNGINYTYRIAGYTDVNISIWSVSDSTNTDFPSPANLSVLGISDSEIELSWIDRSSFEDGFVVERDGGNGFFSITELNANTTNFRDTELLYGTDYSYRIAAKAGNRLSAWISIASVQTVFPAPTNLSAITLTDSEVMLTWNDNCGFETGYKIERDDGSGFTALESLSANTTNYTDSGLTIGVNYNYRVAAFTTINISSEISTGATTQFQAPSDLEASSLNDEEIQLSWTDNTSFENGYILERDSGGGFVEIYEISTDITEYLDNGLNFGQSYHYRVAAFTDHNVSAYSTVVTATAIAPLIDYDGNEYQTVKIGDQVWMAENLKSTHYRNGEDILTGYTYSDWASLTTSAYCILWNNVANEISIFGALYNWYAVNDVRDIAPEGWHIPTDAEWKELEMTLGMSQSEADTSNKYRGTDEGSKLAGETDLWNYGPLKSNSAFDSSRFRAIAGGYRDSQLGYYGGMNSDADFWSASANSFSSAWSRKIYCYTSGIYRWAPNRSNGFAVRCVRD